MRRTLLHLTAQQKAAADSDHKIVRIIEAVVKELRALSRPSTRRNSLEGKCPRYNLSEQMQLPPDVSS